jgi:hypothetical protein
MYLDWLRISKQTAHEDTPSWQFAAAMKARERQKRIAEYGFRLTKPLHSLIFQPTRQGNVVRRAAYRVFRLIARRNA